MTELFYGLAFLGGAVCGFLLGIGAMFSRSVKVTDRENREQRETIAGLRKELMAIDQVCGELGHRNLTPPFTGTQATAESVRWELEQLRATT